ncbi:hypothetical protein HSTV1_31 [Haloarcula sinaiiensis tailed virus 1]|uniref:Uncharacterized protein n=1 Tax=Haloarcula sinaiiensis tailed virus 1 TaxID=1262530 RepID=R9QSS8_9CAUD|nr:hypothetical protein HSTV1_31 [Haloarcula sinaiiensis tailed virus 1]AGC34576.1 hypothetical protein HSTV1_31 [Haloarcula sinaiiensis tailed virus 1]
MASKRTAAEQRINDQYGEDTGVTSYQFFVPDSVWSEWQVTVPRNTTLYERLWALLEQDARATTSDGFSDMEERTARLLASRIQQRAVNAASALDDSDPDRARDELDAIKDIAGQFEA